MAEFYSGGFSISCSKRCNIAVSRCCSRPSRCDNQSASLASSSTPKRESNARYEYVRPAADDGLPQRRRAPFVALAMLIDNSRPSPTGRDSATDNPQPSAHRSTHQPAPAPHWSIRRPHDQIPGSMVHPLRLLLQQRQQLLRRGVIVKTRAAAGGGGDGKINVMQRLGKGGIGGDTIEDVA